MRYSRVYVDALGFELPFEVVPTSRLEGQLSSVYQRLHIAPGQVEALTGVTERRFWPPGFRLSTGAAQAARKALAAAGRTMADVDALVYASVCREYNEPATACSVAAQLGARPQTLIYDISNACLGVMNAITDLAARIELGEIRAGLVVACETAREINEFTIARLQECRDREDYYASLATLTGGSGAAAVLITDGGFPGGGRHRLVGGVARSAAEHHELCQWGFRPIEEHGRYEPYAHTDAAAVLRYGVKLGTETWQAFLETTGWTASTVDRCISHQVGRAHREHILASLGIPESRDFPTYQFLGNMGTVSLPLTAALAAERGFLRQDDRVAWLGIGSGLNCLMLGLEW